jgi:acyl-CoA thioester hydrolase
MPAVPADGRFIMAEHKTQIRVIYADTDAMGVVYHTNYIKWFEVGRSELLRSLGYPYVRMEEEGVLLPVAECSCKYRSPAVYDDVLEITARIAEMKGATVTLEYEIRKQVTGELLVTGSTKHAITDPSFKPIRLRDKNPVLHELLMK